MPGAGPQADRGPGRLHLRRVHQPVPGDHRGGDAGGAEDAPDPAEAPEPSPDQGHPRRVRHLPGEGEEGPLGRGLQPLQADQRGRGRRRGRAPEVERPAGRAHRLGQDPARPDAGAHPRRPVLHRRRHLADRGRLRRRGRREHPAAADPGGRLRRRAGPARDHLHRRDRQDRAQGRQPVDHPRRVRRGRPAGAARRSSRARSPMSRPRAVASTPTRTSSRSTRRTCCSSAAARSTAWSRSSRSGWGSARSASAPRSAMSPAERGQDPREADARGPAQVRADPGVRRPAARSSSR